MNKEINNKIKKWERLPENMLAEQICAELETVNGPWSFGKTTYPLIEDVNLRDRVILVLSKLASNPLEEKWFNCSGPSLYTLSGVMQEKAKKIILNIISKINDPISFKNKNYLFWLNTVIRDLQLEEALGFLINELESLLQTKDTHKWVHTAYLALRVFKPDVAADYNRKLKLLSADVQIDDWSKLSYDELVSEVKKSILSSGMAGSTSHISFIPHVYEHIDDVKLKGKVNKILFNMIDEIENGVGDRAIYICSNLRMDGIKEKMLGIMHGADKIFAHIQKATEDKDWIFYVNYLRELNAAIGLLKITEAKDFLVKQLAPLKKQVPQPTTKEYQLYYGSALTALAVLQRIDPELAKKYKA